MSGKGARPKSKPRGAKANPKSNWPTAERSFTMSLGPYQLLTKSPMRRYSGHARKHSGESERMRWSTNHDTYGNFLETWERTYLPRLPSVARNRPGQVGTSRNGSGQTNSARKQLSPATSQDYGNFYSTHRENSGKRVYSFKPSFLPPICPDPKETEKYYTERGPERFAKSGQAKEDAQTISLPHIQGVDVQFMSKDFSTVTLFPNSKGECDYVTFPHGTHSIKIPDIREVTVKVTKTDGTVVNFRTQPQFHQNY